MPIEIATYIHQLDASNPAAPDLLADTDNHLRMIKSTLKTTFPNIQGVVTSSHNDLNRTVPIGGIILWSGAVAQIPSGWVLCSGQTGLTRTDGNGTINAPDLRNKFVVGAGGSDYAVGATGGNVQLTGTTDSKGGHTHTAATGYAGGHNHGGATGGWALTVEQMPPHTHALYVSPKDSVSPTGSAVARGAAIAGTQMAYGFVGHNGGDVNVNTVPHDHPLTAEPDHTHEVSVSSVADHYHAVTVTDGRPPYYALAYIMRI